MSTFFTQENILTSCTDMRSRALGSLIRRFRIKSLKTQVKASLLQCALIAKEFEKASTDAERIRLIIRHDRAVKRIRTAQQLLEWLERREREQTKAEV